MEQATSSQQLKLDCFLVCGLGSLGQHCVAALKEFGVSVIAIEQTLPEHWEISNLSDLLEELIIGDCSQKKVLEQAKIWQCRAVVIVTSNERINTETALIARQLNPHTRLVVRSAQENLNQLLSQRLGNFVAYEATQLPAPAFALAALGCETLGFFQLDGKWLRVFTRQMQASDPYCNRRQIWELNSRSLRVLTHVTSSMELPKVFRRWDQETLILPGDTIVCIEITDPLFSQSPATSTEIPRHWWQLWQERLKGLSWNKFKQKLTEFWYDSYRLLVGDRMVVLATINGLQRIEGGKMYIQPKQWRVRVEKALTQDAVFEGANAIARISGCTLQQARKLMQNLPGTVPRPLYRQQAQRLVRQLSKRQVSASLVEIPQPQQAYSSQKPK
ncbi:MAG: hypothetical protein F6K58_22745 [Symploca sp. SIO2E9]|nr:hypothetical protein [Symploca sp. SIO2E9]